MPKLHSVFINVKVLHLHTKPEESVRQTQFDFQILVDLGVHTPINHAKEPHRAQDLGEGDQENKVGCVLSQT